MGRSATGKRGKVGDWNFVSGLFYVTWLDFCSVELAIARTLGRCPIEPALSGSRTLPPVDLANAASREKLHGKKQILGEKPFGIEPLLHAAVSSPFAHADHFLRIVLV